MRVVSRRPVSRWLDAELAHRLGFLLLRVVLAVPPLRALVALRCAPPDDAAVEVLGVRFPGPLGVAAGFDKNARGVLALSALGFGFVEIGTVTARPQPGNPRPRLARLPADRAIVNRMGFNNDGADAVAARLAELRRTAAGRRAVIGVNIGRSKLATPDEVVADYSHSARVLAPHADYLAVNISSPNTPGLRDLHAVDTLRPLLAALRTICDDVPGRDRLPLLVKVSPDAADADLLAVADLALELGVDGLIATNTTVARTGLTSRPAQVAAAGDGGLSGPVLAERAETVLRLLRARAGDRLVLIGVGGIDTPAAARARLAAGADLVQAYTGFVWGGPAWPARVTRGLAG